jgi:tetratricopeptide (TPR) repeat protein
MKKLLFPIAIIFILCGCKQKKNNNGGNAVTSSVISQFQKLIQQYPDSVGLRLRFVDALDSLQQYNSAVAQLDTLIKKDGGNYGLWFRRGKLLEDAKDTGNAISSYNNALKIYPSPDGQLTLANLLAEKKDKRALDICNNILNLKMGREFNAHCFFISGVYYARTGNTTKALQQFDQCILNNYNYMVAYMEKGFIYFDEKNYDEALKTFNTAANIQNTSPDAYYWMAKCYEAKNQKQDAVKNYETAFQLDSTMKEAAEAIKRINGIRH